MTSSHVKYVPCGFAPTWIIGMFALKNFCVKSWLPSMYSTH